MIFLRDTSKIKTHTIVGVREGKGDVRKEKAAKIVSSRTEAALDGAASPSDGGLAGKLTTEKGH
jgi:hypothetical protein